MRNSIAADREIQTPAVNPSFSNGRRSTSRILPATIACAVIIASWNHFAAADTSVQEIWVVTDSKHPVLLMPGVRLIELDAPARTEAELTEKLPSDPARAASMVQEQLKKGGTSLQKRLAGAYQGVFDAWKLGVTKIPAIVVDKRYVVYGERDFNRALACIQKYRRSKP